MSVCRRHRSCTVYIDGLPPETSIKSIEEYFSQYGEILSKVLHCEDINGNSSNCYAYVTFQNLSMAERALQVKEHVIHNTKVEVKEDPEHKPRDEEEEELEEEEGWLSNRVYNDKKVFVGGLAEGMREEELKAYFEEYGEISDCVIIHNKETQKPRGFGFVEFESEYSAAKVLEQQFHTLKGRKVEVKRAIPRDILNNAASSEKPNSDYRLCMGLWQYPYYFPPAYSTIPQVPLHNYNNYYTYWYCNPQFLNLHCQNIEKRMSEPSSSDSGAPNSRDGPPIASDSSKTQIQSGKQHV